MAKKESKDKKDKKQGGNAKMVILAVVAVVLLAAGGIGYWMWNRLTRMPAVEKTVWVYIEGNELKTPEVLTDSRIKQALEFYKFDEKLQSGSLEGAYRIDSGMTARAVAQKICFHQQTPVRITFHEMRLKEQWAGKVSEKLMCDSASVMAAMLDPEFLQEAETDEQNVIGILLPDTYEVYWNVKPKDLMQRMLKEYRKFWSEARVAKADGWGLTPQEVTILGSIAEEETQNRSERGVVAMLYWNRLQFDMPLQADPTVKFALKDFGLKRILNKHLEVESPYNTYKYAGLPPGPIRMVDKTTLDTILNARIHTYLYMCAKPDFSGKHNFATTYSEHLRNAAAYHRALDAR